MKEMKQLKLQSKDINMFNYRQHKRRGFCHTSLHDNKIFVEDGSMVAVSTKLERLGLFRPTIFRRASPLYHDIIELFTVLVVT